MISGFFSTGIFSSVHATNIVTTKHWFIPRFRAPLFAYRHSGGTPTGCAITGGAFYNPATATFPSSFVGKYFYADFCSGRIWSLDRLPDGSWRQAEISDTELMISSFGEDQNGEQYVTSLEPGGLYRIVFASTAR